MRIASDGSPLGVYIHVPFCASLCGYCDFYRIQSDAGVPEGFEDLVLAEASLYKAEPRAAVDTIFIGGGTPSLLEPVRLGHLLRGLREAFDIEPDSEVTLEANPETVTFENLSGWAEAGVNRLSIGVQSTDPCVLKLLERRAGPEQSVQAVEMALAKGFKRVSADLMTGVPGQGLSSFLADVALLASLPVDHLSVYALDLHRGARLFDAVVRGELRLPDDDEAAEAYMAVHERLFAFGFEHYEISNYARPGGRCLHNLKYWRCQETVGLGPSAWGRFRGRLTGNVRDVGAWASAVQRGEHPHETVEEITEGRRKHDRLIFGLRLSNGVELDEVWEIFGEEGRDPGHLVETLVANGYAEVEEGRLRLTPLGFLTSNEVLTFLLPDHRMGGHRLTR